MIEIKEKKDCTGCGACINACPLHIISFREDEEGFVYPLVNAEKCINCHLCEKSCPMLKDRDSLCLDIAEYPQFYAGQLSDKNELLNVSSGGAFWAFAQTVISLGGVVFGAVQMNVDEIFHYRATNDDDIKRIRRSKYFQSDTRLTMSQVKDDLKKGYRVLYSGTGCQIAGLKSFLSKEYDNLVTCEVVCHGVPSRKVWKKYREEKEQRESKKIQDLVFRDKTIGWSKNQYKIIYTDGSVEYKRSNSQLFHAGYLKGFFYRPSCGACKFAFMPRVADITLADYWKYEGRYVRDYPDLGVSLITINSPKGSKLLHLSKGFLDFEETEKSKALSSCRHLNNHPLENQERYAFFKMFFEKGYYAAAEHFILKNRKILPRLKRFIKRIISLG